jgi:hypothetical protein
LLSLQAQPAPWLRLVKRGTPSSNTTPFPPEHCNRFFSFRHAAGLYGGAQEYGPALAARRMPKA